MNAVFFIVCALSLSALCVFAPEKALTAALGGINQALALALTLIPVYSVWTGIYKIFENAKISGKAADILKRPINKIFGNPRGKTSEYISLNVAANTLGIGGAATPLGINACKELEAEGKTEKAELLIVLASAPVQLLPTTAITLMISRGSTNYTSIVIPCFIATIATTAGGVMLLKIFQAIRRTIKNGAVTVEFKKRRNERKATR